MYLGLLFEMQKNWLAKIIDGKYTGVKLSQSEAKNGCHKWRLI